MKAIEFKNVSKYFEDGIIPKKSKVLEDISFTVEKGKTYAYLGPNGAGKTTTIKLMLNFLRPSAGEISILGMDPQDPQSRSSVGYISDHPYFYEYLTAEEYMNFCGELYGMEKEAARKSIDKMLKMVGLEKYRTMKLRKFSRGMGQRLGFAQALMHDPELVILDEPLNGLDPFGRKDLMEIIINLKQQGKTVFFSSHILDDAELVADEVIFINNGKIIFQGEMKSILGEKESEFTVYLSGNDPVINDFCLKNSLVCTEKDKITVLEIPDPERLNRLMNLVGKQNIDIMNIEKKQVKLEDVFMKYYRSKENE